MNSNRQVETEVISIEDDDEEEEDVEVVFSNLDKTYVHRNLIHRKISQEIELLQAMCKHPIPNEFNEFKVLAKKLGFQGSDDIIQSAWHRIFKKHLVKSLSLLNNINPKIRLVELPQLSVDQPSLQVHSSSNISYSVNTVTSPSPPVLSSPSTASLAVPIALICNKSVKKKSKAERTMSHETLIITPGTTHTHDQNLRIKQVIAEPDNIYNQLEGKVSAEKEDSINKNRSQNKKRKMDTVIKEQDKPCSLKSGSENSDNSQVSPRNELLQRYLDSLIPGQNLSNISKKVTTPTAKKRKCSSKQVVIADLPKTLEQVSAESHVGVQAKIIKVKRTSHTNLRKGLSKTMKEISAEELKEFKAEQKRLKNEQKREFELQQLQKVHDRLVDVLIPKYYNKNVNEKG